MTWTVLLPAFAVIGALGTLAVGMRRLEGELVALRLSLLVIADRCLRSRNVGLRTKLKASQGPHLVVPTLGSKPASAMASPRGIGGRWLEIRELTRGEPGNHRPSIGSSLIRTP